VAVVHSAVPVVEEAARGGELAQLRSVGETLLRPVDLRPGTRPRQAGEGAAETFGKTPVEGGVVRDHDDPLAQERLDFGRIDRLAGHHFVRDARSSVMPVMAATAAGIGRPGSRKRLKDSWTEKMRPSEEKSNGTMAISMISSVAGSKPVVSTSRKIARRICVPSGEW
jgi:hypothetical protein